MSTITAAGQNQPTVREPADTSVARMSFADEATAGVAGVPGELSPGLGDPPPPGVGDDPGDPEPPVPPVVGPPPAEPPPVGALGGAAGQPAIRTLNTMGRWV